MGHGEMGGWVMVGQVKVGWVMNNSDVVPKMFKGWGWE